MTVPIRPELRFESVSKSFGQQLVLDDVSFTALGGRILGLVGGNGSGKSTCIRLMAGHLHADAGRVVINGTDIAAIPALHQHLSVLGDMVGLPAGLSVGRSVALMADLLELRADVLDDAMVGLHLVNERGSQVSQLSKGWRQRVKLAVAVAGRGSLLVLDEPTNGLDGSSKDWLADHLAYRRAAGHCVVLVTHEFPELEKLADDMVVLQHKVLHVGLPVGSSEYHQLLKAA